MTPFHTLTPNLTEALDKHEKFIRNFRGIAMTPFHALLCDFLRAYHADTASVLGEALDEREIKLLAAAVRQPLDNPDVRVFARPWPWGLHRIEDIDATFYWAYVYERVWTLAWSAGVPMSEARPSFLKQDPNYNSWQGVIGRENIDQWRGRPRSHNDPVFPTSGEDCIVRISVNTLEELRRITPAPESDTIVYVGVAGRFYEWDESVVSSDNGGSIISSEFRARGRWMRLSPLANPHEPRDRSVRPQLRQEAQRPLRTVDSVLDLPDVASPAPGDQRRVEDDRSLWMFDSETVEQLPTSLRAATPTVLVSNTTPGHWRRLAIPR